MKTENFPKIVSSYNEWDPLEEVIVGDMFNATIPTVEVAVQATIPDAQIDYFKLHAGQQFSEELVGRACRELDDFSRILSDLGIAVRRPEKVKKTIPYSTPHWKMLGGLYSAMPRDSLLVVGDTIIEAPMAWRSRYFETDAFRPLLKEYFHRGANWIAAPKPQLLDATFDKNYDRVTPYLTDRYAVSEFEPTFDAADFIRCGEDIFVQKSHVTNDFGIEWVRRSIGSKYRVHKVDHCDDAPMHIDATLLPLCPGKLMIHPERIKNLPSQFAEWEVRVAPSPAVRPGHTLYMSSAWLSMNVLMLSPDTVVVETHEAEMINFFEKWGFNVVPVRFSNVIRFGGAFHCVTADVRRRGELQNYF
ncbi:amidinotransferase [Variovorax humicola]|uniref:Amidinotransferase n=1 Tax=Variovorax humicola TaxID=1769758 RepID=A0ABU8VWE9_9BURK